jgi:hypothetical protein
MLAIHHHYTLKKIRSNVRTLLLLLVLVTAPLLLSYAHADEEKKVRTSPKSPWGEFTVVQEKERVDPWYVQVLFWIPNRMMDFIDIFRVDVGIGPSYGAVVRLSKYGQFGYRNPDPTSVRLGAFGRHQPFLIERSTEFGIGPGFVDSKERKVCPGEVGLGADLLIGGAYAGICIEEVVDFAAGLFFIDIMNDDAQ